MAAPSLMLASDVVLVDVGLQLVRRRHHHQVGPGAPSATLITLKPSASAFLAVAEPARSADGDVRQRRILQVQRMRTALRAVADDGTFLPLIRLRSASRS
jgi:hypothetical protein